MAAVDSSEKLATLEPVALRQFTDPGFVGPKIYLHPKEFEAKVRLAWWWASEGMFLWHTFVVSYPDDVHFFLSSLPSSPSYFSQDTQCRDCVVSLMRTCAFNEFLCPFILFR